MKVINSFRGKYNFLSNFYEVPVTVEGITYKSAEAAFQAQKTLNESDKEVFKELNAKQAKAFGKKVKLRDDWEDVKKYWMLNVVYAKFSQNAELREMLLETGDAYLEEGNTWGDRYWGTVNGIGENNLGKILMGVRKEFIERDKIYITIK